MDSIEIHGIERTIAREPTELQKKRVEPGNAMRMV
jgi:hypothetical protein